MEQGKDVKDLAEIVFDIIAAKKGYDFAGGRDAR